MDSRLYINWDEPAYNNIKYENYNSNDGYMRACEGNLNFSTGAAVSEDDADYTSASYHKKGKIARQDPLSHRIIEKRRRDRMNNCLADLSRLIPPEYLKKGRGRIEKTEIIEMAIKHLKYLKEKAKDPEPQEGPISLEHYRLGYQECLSEVVRYLVEHQNHLSSDSVCVQIVHHLQRHCDRIIKNDQLINPRSNPETTCSSSLSSINYAGDVNPMMADNINQVNSSMTDNSLTTNDNMNTFASQESKDYRRLCNDSTTNGTDSESPIISIQNPNAKCCDRQNSDDLSLQKMPDHLSSSREFLDFANRSQNDVNKYEDTPPSYAQKEHILRSVRKLTYSVEDLSHGNLDHESAHSYKFKNTIQQRFSESQVHSSRPASPGNRISSYSPSMVKCNQIIANGKAYKRRRTNAMHRDLNGNCDQSLYKGQNSGTSLSSGENAVNLSQELQNFSRSNEDTIEISPEERYKLQNYRISKYSDEDDMPKSRQAPTEKYYKQVPEPKSSGISVPIFALHAKGAFYVPLNIEYECLVPFLGPYDLLSVSGLNSNISLHPVTISVNFQPSLFISNKKLQNAKPKVESSDWQ